MKRRDFLKILGVAPVVAAVPALAKTNGGVIGGFNVPSGRGKPIPDSIKVYEDRGAFADYDLISGNRMLTIEEVKGAPEVATTPASYLQELK